jgi:hypothetical protein
MNEHFLEIVREAIQMNSSPSIDRSDAHGKRGQAAYIVVDNHVSAVAWAIWQRLRDEQVIIDGGVNRENT